MWGDQACDLSSGGTNPGERCRGDGDCTGGGTCGTNWLQSVSGGSGNSASGKYSSVSGGDDNTASGDSSSVSGGPRDEASGCDSTAAGRAGRRGEVDAAVERWREERPPREAMEAIQARRVPAGIVAHARHHADDPHLTQRGYRKAVAQQDLGDVLLEGTPFVAADMPPPINTTGEFPGGKKK